MPTIVAQPVPVASPAADGPVRTRAASSHIPSLDGIRAVAFSLVFIAHAGLGHIVPGGLGVTIFFFLSGYLITTLLRREFEKTGRISLRNFYLRRVLRIFPPMYITLGAVVVLTLIGLVKGPILWRAVGAQVVHMTNYYVVLGGEEGIPLGTKAYWSLAVEEHFYLVFPLVCLLTLPRWRFRGVAWGLLAACATVLAWRCYLVYGVYYTDLSNGLSINRPYIASDTRIDSILFGCVMALGCNPHLDGDQVRHKGAKVAMLAGGVLLLLLTLLLRDNHFREGPRYSLQGIALFPLFYLAITNPDWIVFRWLNWPSVRFIGLLSYTLYLCHHTPILALREAWPDASVQDAVGGLVPRAALRLLGGWHGVQLLCVGIASAVIIFVYAVIMYYLVERPCARLRRRLHTD